MREPEPEPEPEPERCSPAAGPPVGLWPLLLLGLLMQLGEDEAVPALDEAAQSGLARLLIRVSQDQAQCGGLRNGAKSPQEVTGLEDRWRNTQEEKSERREGKEKEK